jgi:hypothetical protein
MNFTHPDHQEILFDFLGKVQGLNYDYAYKQRKTPNEKNTKFNNPSRVRQLTLRGF